MANEFIIKNGFVSKGNGLVDGTLTTTSISEQLIIIYHLQVFQEVDLQGKLLYLIHLHH